MIDIFKWKLLIELLLLLLFTSNLKIKMTDQSIDDFLTKEEQEELDNLKDDDPNEVQEVYDPYDNNS